MSHHTNILRIRAVARALQALKETVVFVGGATVSLYGSVGATEVRPTDDVDVIVELAAYKDYAALEDRLRSIGFVNDWESGVICRYTIQGVIVDIMPTVSDALGFSNEWYVEGFQNAIDYRIDEDLTIKIFSLPYFLASKIEAFKSRGENEYRFSSDFEDIVYILEHGAGVEAQLFSVKGNVRSYLQTAFQRMLEDPFFEEGIYSHLDRLTAEQQMERIRSLLIRFVHK
jgi:predicted nucleotidyltransferase